jgi:AcrR family transcriptional regulator
MPLEDRRTQLLDAALQIIVRDGYDNLSIDAIAKEAGVTRPVVYSAYDGLGQLLSALLDRQQARALLQLFSVIPDEPDLSDPDTFMVETIERLMHQVMADPLTWRPILDTQRGMPEVVRARVESDKTLLRKRVAELVAEGLAQRGGPVLDPEVTAHLLVAVAEHFGRLLLDDDPPFEPDRLVKAIRTLLVALRPVR